MANRRSGYGHCPICKATALLVEDHCHECGGKSFTGTGKRGDICDPCNKAMPLHLQRNLDAIYNYLKSHVCKSRLFGGNYVSESSEATKPLCPCRKRISLEGHGDSIIVSSDPEFLLPSQLAVYLGCSAKTIRDRTNPKKGTYDQMVTFKKCPLCNWTLISRDSVWAFEKKINAA